MTMTHYIPHGKIRLVCSAAAPINELFVVYSAKDEPQTSANDVSKVKAASSSSSSNKSPMETFEHEEAFAFRRCASRLAHMSSDEYYQKAGERVGAY